MEAIEKILGFFSSSSFGNEVFNSILSQKYAF